ncbi:unnamed protein product [Agarophyton chilense]
MLMSQVADDLLATQSVTPKTRAQLKRELDETLADGEEHAFLHHVEMQLDQLQSQLRDLSATRAAIMRQISVRERKLNDWKGKIPRTADFSCSDAQREVQRAGQMPCICVARFRDPQHIFVEKMFCNALQGVERFSKLWLLMLAPTNLRFRALCLGRDVHLCLVQVRACDSKRALLTIDPIPFDGDPNQLAHTIIFDMKPYLSYCEAWTEKPLVGYAETNGSNSS